jgi:N-acyl-D-aspartate/D-glutamate deacylase
VSAHDLVLRGGSVVDGTGAPARTADVAVDAGQVTAVGSVDGRGRREIAADGLLVTPGWVVQHVDGYVATIVAGETTFEHGEPTGARPGGLVRFGR